MARFDEYLREVQRREGLQPRELIRPWTLVEIERVDGHVRRAVGASGIVGQQVPGLAGLTNQARGNQVANHFRDRVQPHLEQGAQIISAPGLGYPDLLMRIEAEAYLMEAKATSGWNDADANRRVLTSSPHKMLNLLARGHVAATPAHLIVSVHYDRDTSVLNSVRLDFIDPDTTVNIRLEASTSQRLLAEGAQQVRTIP